MAWVLELGYQQTRPPLDRKTLPQERQGKPRGNGNGRHGVQPTSVGCIDLRCYPSPVSGCNGKIQQKAQKVEAHFSDVPVADIEVLVLLYSLAHGLSLSVVGSAFGIPKSTVHRIIKHVTEKIKANLKTLISLPTADELPEIADGFCQLAKSPAFHRAAGAIDGCHIRIKPPGNEYHKEYINYKLFPSIQMQAICDSTGRFLDVFIGYPGSVHDARVLRNSPIFCQALFPPAGWFLLGDGGYPCLEKPVGLLTPYKVPRGQVQARFNRHHARARSVVERAFGRMKARWRDTLFKALEVSPSFAPDIIACCAFLHNLCIDMNDVLDDAEAFPPEDGDQSPPPAAACGQESPGHHLRNRIAAQLSAPVQMAPHLRG
ncbi:putative nuclease HARBI1 [Gymnodraco acuticeps]|uniref:Nuclease HARBI1 n=1 Tax=Gymnodraco acuticeps TaxID=8218 RepID=A0A6P8V9Z7_GYMAC|nr:putative nuclease HARBI1 [Gymnodraco acuticeps]